MWRLSNRLAAQIILKNRAMDLRSFWDETKTFDNSSRKPIAKMTSRMVCERATYSLSVDEKVTSD